MQNVPGTDDDVINSCAETLSNISLDCCNPEQLSFIANLLAITISKGKSTDEVNVIGNFIVGVGGLILTIAAQRQFCESKQDKIKQIEDLNKQIKSIKDNL